MVLMVFDDLLTGAVRGLPCGELCHVETKWQLGLVFPVIIDPAVFIELKLWVTIQVTRLLCVDGSLQFAEPIIN